MRLKLHEEVEWIVSHAWSFRFLVLAVVFTGAEAALPLFTEHPPLPRKIFAVVIFLIVSLALISRIIVQQRPPRFFPDADKVSPPAAPVPSETITLLTAATALNAATTVANAAVQANQ